MRKTTLRTSILGLALAALALASAAAAATLPKLPPDKPLPQTGDSPGVVTFSHAAHVDAKRPDCTTCHPGKFRILAKATATPDARISHREMEAGRSCGACHNGTAAHGFDDCTACHRDK